MSYAVKVFQTTVVLIAMAWATAIPASADSNATPGDVARFVAGMEPSSDSALAALTQERTWRLHSNHFNQAWKALEKRQLEAIAGFQKANLPKHTDTMLYLFSGPDFLYANAFYPNAKTYVFTGLEPVGNVPSVTNLSPGSRAHSLQALRASMRTIIGISFFITKDMASQLRAGQLTGTLPVLYVFMARAGKTVEKVELVTLKTDGSIAGQSDKTDRFDAPGAKVTFSDPDGTQKVLYYFRTDLSNVGMKNSGLAEFIKSLGPTDSLVKSASYLMHGGNFKTTRDLILSQSARILQDDSGIPLRFFDRDTWDLKPFGYYLGPIPIFASAYQRDMKALFTQQNTTPIKFGFGYKWRPNQSNVLLATNKNMPEPEMKKEPEEAMEKPEMKPEDDKMEAMDKPEMKSEEKPAEAMEKPEMKPEAEKMEESKAEPAEKPAEAMEKPEMKSEDDNKQESMAKPDEKPAMETSALSMCRTDCASVYEPCRETADVRMESCFSRNDGADCMASWKTDADQCITERIACTQKCG